MSRSRPASNPISYHKHTKQYYVTRLGKRIYLGTDKGNALIMYHQLNLGIESTPMDSPRLIQITMKELANRFLMAQQANWKNPDKTLKSYRDWIGRFLKDHPRLRLADFTVEKFAAWKLSLKQRDYSAESINHYLGAIRAMFNFAEDAGIVEKAPKLNRVKNETKIGQSLDSKTLYTSEQLGKLIGHADLQMKTMILLALNCGFGPKDIGDLTWDHINDERITLPRTKTGVCQTYLMWPEISVLLEKIQQQRSERIRKAAKRGNKRSDNGYVFITWFWKPWSKDAIAEQFRKLCTKAGVTCLGFYRLRHCASTAMSLEATPHVQRKFMRHSRLQQQTTYTHIPDTEVDVATSKIRRRLLGKKKLILNEERNQG